jgi:hypothetical protein
MLGGLRNGFDFFAVMINGQQFRRLRDIQIPQVVVNGLEMPDALASARVESQQAVAEQVVSMAIAAVEVEP